MMFKLTKPGGILPVCLVCGLLSCKDENNISDLEGSLVGYVMTQDEFTNPLPDHKAVYGMVNACENSIGELTSDTIYLRIYP
jgi:hypothetical protein